MIMGRPFKDKKRYMGDDGLWYYRCRTCEQYKSEEEMGKNRNQAFGVDAYCKDCKSQYKSKKNRNSLVGQKSKEYNSVWIAPTGRHLLLTNYNLQDDRDMEEYLTNMGYDLEQPIWEQFGKRIEDKYGVKLEFDDIPYYERDDE